MTVFRRTEYCIIYIILLINYSQYGKKCLLICDCGGAIKFVTFEGPRVYKVPTIIINIYSCLGLSLS